MNEEELRTLVEEMERWDPGGCNDVEGLVGCAVDNQRVIATLLVELILATRGRQSG